MSGAADHFLAGLLAELDRLAPLPTTAEDGDAADDGTQPPTPPHDAVPWPLTSDVLRALTERGEGPPVLRALLQEAREGVTQWRAQQGLPPAGGTIERWIPPASEAAADTTDQASRLATPPAIVEGTVARRTAPEGEDAPSTPPGDVGTTAATATAAQDGRAATAGEAAGAAGGDERGAESASRPGARWPSSRPVSRLGRYAQLRPAPAPPAPPSDAS